jgi:hypothetical protein
LVWKVVDPCGLNRSRYHVALQPAERGEIQRVGRQPVAQGDGDAFPGPGAQNHGLDRRVGIEQDRASGVGDATRVAFGDVRRRDGGGLRSPVITYSIAVGSWIGPGAAGTSWWTPVSGSVTVWPPTVVWRWL